MSNVHVNFTVGPVDLNPSEMVTCVAVVFAALGISPSSDTSRHVYECLWMEFGLVIGHMHIHSSRTVVTIWP
jgi:hypothetical protein